MEEKKGDPKGNSKAEGKGHIASAREEVHIFAETGKSQHELKALSYALLSEM